MNRSPSRCFTLKALTAAVALTGCPFCPRMPRLAAQGRHFAQPVGHHGHFRKPC
jgi:hypothetical protein